MGVDELTVIVGLIGSAIGAIGTVVVNVVNARGKNSHEQLDVIAKQKDEVALALNRNIEDKKAEIKEYKAEVATLRDDLHKAQDQCADALRSYRRCLKRSDQLRSLLKKNSIAVEEES